MSRRTRKIWIVGIFLFCIYLSAYIVLSRRGYAEARNWNAESFYYLSPQESSTWTATNGACRLVFAPLNTVDCWLGLGFPPAADPMWGVSK